MRVEGGVVQSRFGQGATMGPVAHARGGVVTPRSTPEMDVEVFRTALIRKRGELLGGTAAKPLQWTMENNSGRQGDVADQAAGNNEVHVQLKLKQTDAKILQAIDC